MSWWGGLHTPYLRERFVGWNAYQKMLDMQKQLLITGAKRAKLWTKLWNGEKCICVEDEQQQTPHHVCYGTGWVGGYKEYGWREWLIYKKSATLYRFISDVGSYDIVPQVNADIHTVISNWIPADDLLLSIVKSMFKLRNLEIYFSVDGINWVSSVQFPVAEFKIKVVGKAFDMEVIRVRGKEGVDEVLFSEAPPRKFEEWIRSGMHSETVDIRCWTINEPLIFTGDIVEWLEGHWIGERYAIVDLKASQFRTSDTESSVLTQFTGMRHIETYQQTGRIW